MSWAFQPLPLAQGASGPQQFQQNLTASLSFSAANGKASRVTRTAALSFSVAIVAGLFLTRAFTAALSFSGSAVERMGKSITAALAFTGSVVKRSTKTLISALSFAGASAKRLARALSSSALSFTAGSAGISYVVWNSSDTAALSQNVVTTAQAGDVLLAWQVSDSTGNTPSWPSGFTEIANQITTTDSQVFAVAIKNNATGSEGTLVISSDQNIIAGIVAVRGADNGAPQAFTVNVVNQNTASINVAVTSGSVTPNRAGTMILAFMGIDVTSGTNCSATFSNSGSLGAWTTIADRNNGGGFFNVVIGSAVQAAAGAITVTATSSTGGNTAGAALVTVGIRPASASGGVARRIGRALAAALSFAGTVTKEARKGLAAALSWIGEFASSYIPAGGGMSYQAFTAALSFAGGATKRTSRALTATALSFVGVSVKKAARPISGLLGFTVGNAAEISFTLLTNGVDTGGTESCATASVSVTAGDTIIVEVNMNHGAVGAGEPPATVAGAGMTFQKLADASADLQWDNISRWVAEAPSTTSGAITITNLTGRTINGCGWAVIRVNGCAKGANGSNAFIQTVSGRNGSSAAMSLTLSAFASANNYCLSAFNTTDWGGSGYTATPDGGATELLDYNWDGGGFRDTLEVQYKQNQTNPGVTFTGQYAGIAGVASEVAAGSGVAGFLKRTNKPFAGVASFAGALARSTKKALASALSWIGNLNSSFNGGAQQFNQALNAALSFTGAQTRRVTTTISAATLSFAGAAAKRTVTARTAALSFVGATTKRSGKILSGVLSFVGAIRARAAKALTATISFAGATTKRVARALTAALSWIGNLASQKIGGPTQYTQALSGALSFTATKVNRVYRAITATLSFAGTATKRLARALTAALSLAGSIVTLKSFNKALTATLSFVGTQSKRTSKSLIGGLSFVGSILRRTFHKMTAALTPIGVLLKRSTKAYTATLSFIGSTVTSRLKVWAMTATLAFTGAYKGRANKAMNGVITFSTAMKYRISKVLDTTLTFTTNITRYIVRVSMNSVLGFTGVMTAFVGYVTISVERTYRILAENRYYIVVVDGRVRIVSAEEREHLINNQDR